MLLNWQFNNENRLVFELYKNEDKNILKFIITIQMMLVNMKYFPNILQLNKGYKI